MQSSCAMFGFNFKNVFYSHENENVFVSSLPRTFMRIDGEKVFPFPIEADII